MDEFEATLRDEGISQEAIDEIKTAIASATHEVFEEYGVSLDTPEVVIDAIQTTLIRQAVELGQALDHNSLVAQSDKLREDFETPDSDSARSNILYALGSLKRSNQDPPECVIEIGGAILSYNNSSESS